MSRSKENTLKSQNRTNFIRFLLSEYYRRAPKPSKDAYQEIIKFIDTNEGQRALEQFQNIDPARFGKKPATTNGFKRVLQS